MNGSAAVAISAYRSDDAVIDLLKAVFSDPHPFVSSIIVVDSLGSERLAAEIAVRRWPVHYENFTRNLGSAGNLKRRIEVAAAFGDEWCLCLNHDANWSSKRLNDMLQLADSRNKIGAVYPVLHHGQRKNPWEDGRRSFAPSSIRRHSSIPDGDAEIEVLWSSSNGALYSTAPLREGIEVMDELWMGYEDLAYGIALSQRGWNQLVCRTAILGDIFDLAPHPFLGRRFHIPDKPAWYCYYDIRNLLLIRRRYGAKGVSYPMILKKLVHSIARILLFEDEAFKRITQLFRGAIAGLLGRAGKGPLP